MLEAGTREERGHADGVFVAGPLVLAVAGLEVAGVVTGEENDGVAIEAERFESVEDAPESFVEAFDHAPVPAEVSLGGAADGATVGVVAFESVCGEGGEVRRGPSTVV